MNWLQNIQFDVQIERLPSLAFRASKVSIPGIELTGPRSQTPFSPLNFTPDSITYSQLSISCGLDEKMEVWQELFKWALMGFPTEHQEFNNSRSQNTHYSDMTLIMLDSKKNKFGTFEFKNCCLLNMSPINFDTQQTTVQPFEFSADFNFDSMEFKIGD